MLNTEGISLWSIVDLVAKKLQSYLILSELLPGMMFIATLIPDTQRLFNFD
jgi:hypothetical protein